MDHLVYLFLDLYNRTSQNHACFTRFGFVPLSQTLCHHITAVNGRPFFDENCLSGEDLMKKFLHPSSGFALALLVAGLAPQNSSAQSTLPLCRFRRATFPSACLREPACGQCARYCYRHLSGSGSVSFTNVTVAATGTPDYSADFIVDGNSCTGMIAAPIPVR